MIIINAENQVLGRLAVFAAKKALLGEEVNVVNAEKAVVSGTRADVLAKFKQKKNRGIPLKGPYYPRTPAMIVRRAIRGMVPYKQEKGKVAFDRIKCFVGMPTEFEGKAALVVPGADASKITRTKYVTIAEISKELGAKQ